MGMGNSAVLGRPRKREMRMRTIGMLTTGVLALAGAAAVVVAAVSAQDAARYLRMRKM